MQIDLTKRGDAHTIDLSKTPTATSVLANLNWDANGIGSKPDLDLGCMYELNNGDKGVIQPLGNAFGSATSSPHIMLENDDRSGASVDGENMRVFKPGNVRRVMFFALLYDGATEFSEVNGRMRIHMPDGTDVNVRLTSPIHGRRFCAVALLENVGGQLTLRKEDRYFDGHQAADTHYGFGFQWQAGSK